MKSHKLMGLLHVILVVSMLCMTITRADDDDDSMEVFNINKDPTMLTVFDYDKLVVDETKGKVK